MNLRLHPCSVTPAETRRAGQAAPPAEGLSCNNAARVEGKSIDTLRKQACVLSNSYLGVFQVLIGVGK